MTTILTTCVNCGTTELTIWQITLEPGYYRFTCTNCNIEQRLPSSSRVERILIAAGVKYAPITEDEIDLFVMELDLREGIEI